MMNKILLFLAIGFATGMLSCSQTDIGKKQIVFLKPIRLAKKGY